ncbi:Axial budding pattern protein 2 [Paramyrothecium foliicola]|nr:Axial budding pattern protein 2 [Paramyrothecium foliicola]
MIPFAIVVALQLLQVANAQPTISFPFNSQLPPVARIDREFSYVFSSYTFKSDSDIKYSLGAHPAWLSLNGDERRLFGRPEDKNVPSGDVVGQNVEIIATDSAGSTTLNATLVVSRHKGPSIKIPVADQMQKLGRHSAPSTLLAYPQSTFRYTFDPNTFNHEPDMINYYAVSANSSPLPSWVKFDSSTLTFYGTTPSFETLVQPPQTFNFELVASDIVGFSAVSLPFSIMVGVHKLTAENPIVTLSTVRGSKVSYDNLKDEIKLDGRTPQSQDLKVSTSELPPWLAFDLNTWKVEGTPKESDHSTNFTIKFGDVFQDTLEVMFMVKVATGLFQTTFEDIQVKAGEDMEVDLAPYFRNPQDIEIKVNTEPSRDWLKVSGLKLIGTVPDDAAGNTKVSVEAASRLFGLKETETLGMQFIALDKLTSTSTSPISKSTTTSARASQSQTDESFSDEDPMANEDKGFSTGKILLATLLPILAVAFILMFLICFMRRRRAARSNYLNSKIRHNISKPIVGSLRVNGSDASVQHIEKIPDTRATEKNDFTPAATGYTEMESQTSTVTQRSGSSENISASALPRGYMADSRIRMSANPSHMSTEDRQSWFTVEGTATAPASERAVGSQPNIRAYPESRQQLLPAPEFRVESPGGSVAGSVDFGVPLFGDRDHYGSQHTAIVAYNATGRVRARESSDALSTTTSSSAALPGSGPDGDYRVAKSISISKAPRTVRSSSQPSPLTSDSSEEKLDELRALNRARVSSVQWLTRQHESGGAWYDVESSNGSKSLGTGSASFGSTENWRSIVRHETRSPTYGELVDAAPFHPSRPSTVMIAGVLRDGALPGERDGEEWMSPSRWGPSDPGLKRRTEPPTSRSSMFFDSQRLPAMPSAIRFADGTQSERSVSNRLSRLTETSSLNELGEKPGWKSTDADAKTPKASEGSFKMFI